MARLLSSGMTGLDVSELQAALNFHVRSPATPLQPDGNFGKLTDTRVRDFQRLAKIKDDGLVGPRTIAALYRTIKGAIDARLKPRTATAGGRSLTAFRRGFGPDRPANPLLLLPQTSSANSQGFELESKLPFNPLAKPSLGEHPLQLTLSKSFPWPVFLPEPLTLVIDAGVGAKVELDGKIKVPFKLIDSARFELKPYFFTGAGVSQDNFKDISAGGGAALKLKLFTDIGGTGTSLSLEADGGIKYKHDLEKNEGKVKGYLESTVVITVPFDIF